MKKALEIFIGICMITAIIAAIWLSFIDGIGAGLIFVLVSSIFLGAFATLVEKVDIVLTKVFSPPQR